MTVQLRRYDLQPGMADTFAEWWATYIVPVREQYGFLVLFSFADMENDEFVWACAHDDFDAAEARYLESPERVHAFANAPTRAIGHHITRPRLVYGPWEA
jgi:hypothetical protein